MSPRSWNLDERETMHVPRLRVQIRIRDADSRLRRKPIPHRTVYTVYITTDRSDVGRRPPGPHTPGNEAPQLTRSAARAQGTSDAHARKTDSERVSLSTPAQGGLAPAGNRIGRSARGVPACLPARLPVH
ncbi:hypothetical protein C2E23DRAFT_817952 [Lenzites betulinus]|nr:hypothetical protein C2E23DRAFT_817952 [Lenzites betulinus]